MNDFIYGCPLTTHLGTQNTNCALSLEHFDSKSWCNLAHIKQSIDTSESKYQPIQLLCNIILLLTMFNLHIFFCTPKSYSDSIFSFLKCSKKQMAEPNMRVKWIVQLRFCYLYSFCKEKYLSFGSIVKQLSSLAIVKTTQYSWNFKNVSKIFCLSGIWSIFNWVMYYIYVQYLDPFCINALLRNCFAISSSCCCCWHKQELVKGIVCTIGFIMHGLPVRSMSDVRLIVVCHACLHILQFADAAL